MMLDGGCMNMTSMLDFFRLGKTTMVLIQDDKMTLVTAIIILNALLKGCWKRDVDDEHLSTRKRAWWIGAHVS